RAWNWLNDRDVSFNTAEHAQRLSDDFGGGDWKVSVRERYIKLPIPYFDIPIPIPLSIFKRSGTLLRDSDNIATQPIKVTLTIPAGTDKHTAIRNIIHAATKSHSKENSQGLELPSAAKRITYNPIKLFLGLICRRFTSRISYSTL